MRRWKFFVHLFTDTVAKMVPTLTRESWLKLEDFADSELHGVKKFMLLIIRKTIVGKDQWHGIFQGNHKRLKLTAVLEEGFRREF